MTPDDVNNEYFEWLYELVGGIKQPKQISYKKLLMYLHNTVFRYSILNDENRADEGLYLRYRFAHDYLRDSSAERDIQGPCSVLEMMVALALHCEENIMDDPYIGNRTGQWFWCMVTNMGLGSMTDSRFDKGYVKDIVERFLDREYEPNGKGGLFVIEHCDYDLRTVEIWHQLCWYLAGIT